MKNKLTLVVLILAVACLSISCGSINKTVDTKDTTDESRKVNISNIGFLEQSALQFIQGTGEIKGTGISSEYLLSDATIVNQYAFNNSLYLDVSSSSGEKMYRFQLAKSTDESAGTGEYELDSFICYTKQF